ncbi:MAG: acetolactate synthase small subunit [Oscillibacter sp.]|nr:acetolactate synthase small subunit [Oscillibacter sp.]MBD5148307.1 acetolactate synthase small subunit [Oscillibacter sp.]
MKKPMDMTPKLYTLCILADDTPGVLSQVSRLFSRKGYNIESIVTGETDKPHTARLTISIVGNELMISQLADQCRKLLPVQAVKILDENTSIRREFSLIKVHAADRNARDEVIQMANIFRAKIIDVSRETLTVAIFGDKEKTAALTKMLEDYGILEIAKTGTIAIERGRSTIYDDSKLKEEYTYGKNVL